MRRLSLNVYFMDHQETHATGLLTRLGLFTAVMVVISSTIGSGVFKKLAPMCQELQSGWLVLSCWLIAGIITLLGALTNAEIAGLIAEPGGQYAYFKSMYGRFFAFLYGWSCFTVIQSASIAAISYVFAQSVNSLIPLPHFGPELEQWCILGTFYPLHSFGVKLVTILTILLLTGANYLGVVFGGMINNIVTVMKIAGVAIIIALGLAIGGGQVSNISALPNPQYQSSLGLFGAMFAAMLAAFWAYDGWNNIGYLGGEVKNAKRNIPIALAVGVVVVMLCYLAINFVYLYVMPTEEVLKYAKAPDCIIAVEVMRKFAGNLGAMFVSILILISTFGASNGSILSSPRIYFAMAHDRLFFQSASHCHPKFKTPSVALIFQGIWASVLVLSGSFDQLTDRLVFAAFIFYGAGALGVFVLRKKMKDQPRPYKVTGYPFIPALFVLFCIVLVVVTTIQNPINAGVGLALMALGIPFYLFWNYRIPKTSA